MKAKFIAIFLALSVLNIPAQAGDNHKIPPTKQSASASSKINLNKADLATLTGSLKGIGKKRAQAIIDYRDTHKGFKSVEELAEVKGFGAHFVEVNRDKLKEVFIIK